MKTPGFWARRGALAIALAPFGVVTKILTARRVAKAGWDCGVPVFCAGNVGVGGSGKTIVALDLLGRLPGRPFALTRGFGGRLRGPVLVDLAVHTAADVGDEALLLAAAAPTVVAIDRAAGARLAVAAGASAIVMDDGLQNPGLKKTVSLLVIDGLYGFGNGLLLPAGPLREPVAAAAARVQAAVVIGGVGGAAMGYAALTHPTFGGLSILRAGLMAECDVDLAGRRVVAFAGIGRPAKFFESVAGLGAVMVETVSFPDHHVYGARDAARLLAAARRGLLVTTAKDFVKLTGALRAAAVPVRVRLVWEDEAALARVLGV